ncbi:MAG TPA: hypothetical protein VE172_16485 [Stackebrandtia sp.]|jgi:uncharacterized protein YhhL (DUF1145 family)|uniref:hypothetical protein n=1 Tax=Stackebrandtia sp. TaxID=2023065 RepID=UPI002D2C64DF|nr:hypothetical protein [Stackebrandtia sp.]HZE40400.1 hypothetical protein [Stackebrandtia sp.]
MLIPTLEQLTAEHEAFAYRQRFAVYARLYGPAAIAFLAVSLLPLYEDGEHIHTVALSLHVPNIALMLTFTTMIVVLLIGTFRPFASFVGGAIAVAALVLMLVLPMQLGDLESLADTGVIAQAIALVILVTGVIHQIHRLVDRPEAAEDSSSPGARPNSSSS